MKYLLPLVLLMFLTACAGTDLKLIERKIPDELLDPCPAPTRPVVTVQDLNLVLIEYHRALDKCDGQIRSIKRIVKSNE